MTRTTCQSLPQRLLKPEVKFDKILKLPPLHVVSPSLTLKFPSKLLRKKVCIYGNGQLIDPMGFRWHGENLFTLATEGNFSSDIFLPPLKPSSNVTIILRFSYLHRAQKGAKGANVYTLSHLRSMCSQGDNQPPVAPQRGTNQALTP